MANPTPKKESKKKTPNKESLFSPSQMKELPIWSVIAIFVTLTIIFFWGQISGSTFFWDDFTEFVYPMQSFAAVESASGIMPFWNPFSYSGMPFFADLQVGFFYPFNRLLTLFVTSDGRLPVWIIQFIVIFHYFIALFSMFWLCRKWGASSIASIIGAVSYSFSLIIVCHTIHPMIVYHLAWFPLVIMFFYKAIDELNI